MEAHNDVQTQPWSIRLVDLYATDFDKLVAVAMGILRDRGLAEECVQDAFLGYHTKDILPTAGSEASYLRSMVRNGAISLLRREQRRRQACQVTPPVFETSAESTVVALVMARKITSHIGTLAPRQGAVVVHRLLGLSVAETAAEMDVTTGTVKTHRHRAAEAMKISLGACAAG